MRELLYQFWQINYVPLYSIYGQAWFILGLIALIHSRRHSRVPLARSVWLLGLFGITHAFREWGFIFIPIQSQYLPATVVSVMEWTQLALLAISFFFMLAFAMNLIVSVGLGPSSLWVVPVLALIGWGSVVVLMYGVWEWGSAPTFRMADILARYGMALPAGLLAAWALWQQEDSFPYFLSQKNRGWLRNLSLAFLGFAVVDGFIVPKANFFPANMVNYTSLMQTTLIPIPAYRSILALWVAVATWATVRLFEEETRQHIRSLEQERLLLEDRERISRELHDHTVQALYAVGLEIEQVTHLIYRSPAMAQSRLQHVMEHINNIIAETRSFIYDLRKPERVSLPHLVYQALDDVHVHQVLDVDVFLDEKLEQWACPPHLSSHISAILEEALSNIVKHAQAHHVVIEGSNEDDTAILIIRDDGRGFDPEVVKHGMGLQHMQERARLVGGLVTVRSKPGEGTTVRVLVPQCEDGDHEPEARSVTGTPG